MNRRILSILALIAVVSLVTACGGKPTPAPASAPAPAAAPAPASKEPQQLVVAGYGGSFEKAFKEKILPEFEKQFNAKVTYITGASTDTVAKLQAQKDKPQIDVAFIDDGPQAQAKAFGLLDKFDPAKVTNLTKVYDIAKDKDNVGVGFGVVATGITYNTKYFKDNGLAAPTSWKDLAKPEYKGKEVLQSISTTYGVHMLVMLAKANGGSEANIEAGFTAMKAVSPLAVTFDKTADVSNFFLQDQAVIAPWSNSRTYTLAAKNFPVEFVYPKEGAAALFPMINLVKGAPHTDLAQSFINFILDDASQQAIAGNVFFGPTNKNVKLPDDVKKLVVYGEDQFKNLTKMDWATINTNRAAWTERWGKEIEK